MTTTRLSLKYKLLALLVILPVIILGLYLLLAVKLFNSDKEAYVFDSSVSVSRTLSAQVRSTLMSEMSVMRTILEGRGNDGKLGAGSQARFAAETDMEYLSILQGDNTGKFFTESSELKGKNLQETTVTEIKKSDNDDAMDAKSNDLAMRIIDPTKDLILLTVRFGARDDAKAFLARAYFHAPLLFSAFRQSHLYTTYLLNSKGTVLFGSASQNIQPIKDMSQWKFFTEYSSKKSPEGSATIKPFGDEELLASYARVGANDMSVVALVPKNVVFRAVQILLLKSVLFLIAIIMASIIISVIASSQLTSSLRTLAEAAKNIAGGNFNIKVPVKSKDEIGTLAQGFNTMAQEVARLMQDNIEKGRMEKELETAKVVQDTLFPAKNSSLGPVKISGYYEPASECGGDWWYYFKKDKKIFICIGDATGHGVPAALITSAARSAVSLIEISGEITPKIFLELLNRAIYEASRGHIQMTFFVACIDTQTNQMTYANASHNAPFLIRKNTNAIKKKDLIPLLLDNECLRLGQNIDTKYDETSTEFSPGDRVFFYTDGLIDVQDPKGEIWDERGMIKSLTDAATKFKDVTALTESIASETKLFRVGSPLKDDVTFFTCMYSET